MIGVNTRSMHRSWWLLLTGAAACATVIVLSYMSTVQALQPSVTSSAYRLYDNADAVTPGAPLAADNTSAQLVNSNDSFRVRTGLTTRDDAVSFTSMAPGSVNGCAIASGAAYCSGGNLSGALGDGTGLDTTELTPVDTSTGLAGKVVTQIGVGTVTSYPYTCALADGAVYCWGDNFFQSLGAGIPKATLPTSPTPIAVDTSGVLSGKTVTDLAVGSGHTCVIASGKVYCWGEGAQGRLGDGHQTTRSSPVAVDDSGVLSGKTVTSITTGSGHTCVIASGKAYCWGSDSGGQLGDDSSFTNSNIPVAVDDGGALLGKSLVSISAFNSNTCAVASDGGGYCWGSREYFGIGDGGTSRTAHEGTPVAVKMSSGVLFGKSLTEISVGNTEACAISSEGKSYCWGNAGNGSLGNGKFSGLYASPVEVDYSGALSGKVAIDIVSGKQNSCVVTVDGGAYCWGENTSGNLGLGTTGDVSRPVEVLTTNVVAGDGVTLTSGSPGFKLQYAQKTAATCAAQTGYANITASTPIAWSTNASAASHSAITATGNDPATAGGTVVQTYVSDASDILTPNDIVPGDTGMWDFSLKDNSELYNTSFCLRMAKSDGSGLSAYAHYPEIKTAPGTLSLAIVDLSGDPVVDPSFPLTSTLVKGDCQTVTGHLGSSSQKLRVINNVATNGWSLSIAATAGATGLWRSADDTEFYDYNDPSGIPTGCNSGPDGDGFAGQLKIDGSSGGRTYGPGCSLDGISTGSESAFDQGSVDAITLMSGSSASQLYCEFGRVGIGLEQTIPAYQPGGDYTLDLTATVVAQ